MSSPGDSFAAEGGSHRCRQAYGESFGVESGTSKGHKARRSASPVALVREKPAALLAGVALLACCSILRLWAHSGQPPSSTVIAAAVPESRDAIGAARRGSAPDFATAQPQQLQQPQLRPQPQPRPQQGATAAERDALRRIDQERQAVRAGRYEVEESAALLRNEDALLAQERQALDAIERAISSGDTATAKRLEEEAASASRLFSAAEQTAREKGGAAIRDESAGWKAGKRWVAQGSELDKQHGEVETERLRLKDEINIYKHHVHEDDKDWQKMESKRVKFHQRLSLTLET